MDERRVPIVCWNWNDIWAWLEERWAFLACLYAQNVVRENCLLWPGKHEFESRHSFILPYSLKNISPLRVSLERPDVPCQTIWIDHAGLLEKGHSILRTTFCKGWSQPQKDNKEKLILSVFFSEGSRMDHSTRNWVSCSSFDQLFAFNNPVQRTTYLTMKKKRIPNNAWPQSSSLHIPSTWYSSFLKSEIS